MTEYKKRRLWLAGVVAAFARLVVSVVVEAVREGGRTAVTGAGTIGARRILPMPMPMPMPMPVRAVAGSGLSCP
ncbi:hypothetical protein ACIQI8_03910 [Streptomyces sp. NPDC092369]|uniref:hypothetical protein n=1 Tax=Streptomyces sp. NPDC092369 TaxID=3366015 RepID=UPI00382B916C